MSSDIQSTQMLPKKVIDAHHHFLDTTKQGNALTFQAFLASLLPDEQYLPKHYEKDVVVPLREQGISLLASVHVECIPNDGVEETAWVESMSSSTVKAVVGSCDLTQDNVDQELSKLRAVSPRLRGVRWILDCVGSFEPNTATHVATKRHDGIDYLRGSNGPGTYDGTTTPEFERGFALLAKHKLSFDLQCAPVQLIQAAALCQRHPNVPVVIDHLGKPRTVLGADTEENCSNTVPDALELDCWRQGLRAMAALPHVYVKISMLGYAIPGWMKTRERKEHMKALVQEVVQLYGCRRCMVAFNWWKNGAISDSDFLSDVGPTPVEFLAFVSDCLKEYPEEDRNRVFYGTAQEFYRITLS